jgi:hypothetical protein
MKNLNPDYQLVNNYTAPWQKASVINLDTVSPFQIIYTVLHHLSEQKERAVKKELKDLTSTRCFYRLKKESSNKILKCAAGCLIPEYLYEPDFEGSSWFTLVSNLEVFCISHRDLISDLQVLHDKNINWGENGFLWKENQLDKSLLKSLSFYYPELPKTEVKEFFTHVINPLFEN